MNSFVKEFKDFAIKGNALELAVGVIIGGAFGKIISSLVSDILMPPVGLLLGGLNLKDYSFVLKEAVIASDGQVLSLPLTLNIGLFLQNILDFLLIAFSIFLLVKFWSKLKRQIGLEAAEKKTTTPSKEELLLSEIRDLLKEKTEKNNQ
jgi:large conductance mechanosensitive channel